MSTPPLQAHVRAELQRALRDIAPEDLDQRRVQSELARIYAELSQSGRSLTEDARRQMTEAVLHEIVLYGPLFGHVFDPEVTEIMVNGLGGVFVERRGRYERSAARFADDTQLRALAMRLVDLNEGKRLDKSAPMVDLSLPDGSRVNIAVPPVVTGGPHITIRKYLRTIDSLEQLQGLGSMDDRIARFLYGCIRAQANLLFSGGAGSGKTTLVEVLSRYIEARERVVVMEDTLELRFDQPNVVRMLSRPPNIEGKGEITIGQLFRNALRMRPSRIVLGELRGPEALDYLQALNSGHAGALAVVHASRPLEALLRVEQLAASHPLRVPERVIRRQIGHGLDIVVQHAQLADGSRKVVRVSEVSGLNEQGDIEVRDIFEYRAEGRDKHGRIVGGHHAMGVVPHVHFKFELAGVDVSQEIYEAS
ncbi:MAG: CpaF family protein [Alphaproteobacteria bacterium]|nr:CpaF family protein [Alphaproteobacteria bacterium]MCB9796448.1 CpaF family protein [Alphaproteobacteria bacterium]